jgi:5,10-methenyltetrahydromethanopterin hydrogenase
MGISPEKFIAYSVVRTKVTTRACQITILKQKEIAEAKARQNQSKQVLHTASYHSPYIPEYVGNHHVAYVASASHSQVSWPQLPPPPPLQRTYSRSQQPEGS